MWSYKCGRLKVFVEERGLFEYVKDSKEEMFMVESQNELEVMVRRRWMYKRRVDIRKKGELQKLGPSTWEVFERC